MRDSDKLEEYLKKSMKSGHGICAYFIVKRRIGGSREESVSARLFYMIIFMARLRDLVVLWRFLRSSQMTRC